MEDVLEARLASMEHSALDDQAELRARMLQEMEHGRTREIARLVRTLQDNAVELQTVRTIRTGLAQPGDRL